MAKVNGVVIVAMVDMKTCNLDVHAGHDQQILARTSYILCWIGDLLPLVLRWIS